MRYLSAHYIFPVSSPPLKNGIICVDDDGSIVDLIDTGGKLYERANLEFYNGILVPGFINAHCHLELSHLHGVMQPHCGLPDFISSVGKVRTASHETIISAARNADDNMAKNGIVAAGDISNNDSTLDIKANSLIRYHTFIEVFGLDANSSAKIFTSAQRIERMYRNRGLSASIVPHAVYSVSESLWDILHQSYQSSPPQAVSMHHQESGEETGVYLEGKGELASMFRNNSLSIGNNVLSKNVLPKMMHCLLESPRCLLVHNTFSSENDLSKYLLYLERFYFVLCPISNIFIQNRLPDLMLFCSEKLRRNTCIGTDSLASNTCLSILEEMKIIQQHALIPLDMVVQWATLNGARALGFSDSLGSFEKNKTPGVNLITDIDFDRMLLTSKSVVKTLVFNHCLKY